VQILQSALRVGSHVIVRGERWRVVDVRLHEKCALVALAGIGPSNGDVERVVIAPFDVVQPLARTAVPRMASIRQWRRACRHYIATHGSSHALHTARRARIDLLPHQLEPALAVVGGFGSRVLIADEVGLGKTIQAGLVIAELRARGAADRVLVLTPAGLREQWALELLERFGIEAAVVDMRGARLRAAELPVGTNPWTTFPIAVTSIDYVKRPEVRPSVEACRWDVVVVDEAHNAAAASDRHNAVAALCERAAHVLLLTATPHNGDSAAFASLCGLGRAGGDELLVFRRTGAELALGRGRRVHNLRVHPSPAERRMHTALSAVAAAVSRQRIDAHLVLGMLHKRALSSPHSLEQSVARRLAVLNAAHNDFELAQLALPLGDSAGECDDADAPPAWACALADDPAVERRLLAPLQHAARAAAASESKLLALQRLLRRLHARGEQAIVFTEYRDTLFHVQSQIRGEVAVLHGGLTRDQRRAALECFVSRRVPVLLATDAAGEGLNLHHTCRVAINLELPWNPMRLEQRIGRVDRIGQRRIVHAFHLIAQDTYETRLLDRLKARVAIAQRDIGAADPLALRADTELDISRWLIDQVAPPLPVHVYPPMALMRSVRHEATEEHARLVLARAMDAPDEPPARPLVARSRRWRTRLRLRGGTLAVRRSVWEDACGRPVASQVSAVVAPCEALAHGDHHATDPVQAHEQFWTTRRRREQAIAEIVAARLDARDFQPGLFDRRTEYQFTEASRHRAEASGERQRRIAAAEQAARVTALPTQTVLVLKP
jgi:superfamily II DNA or RNA helicase